MNFSFRRLAIDNWSMLAPYDGVYKNSFAIFRRSEAQYLFLESNPKIAAFSSVSDKKLKVDDITEPLSSLRSQHNMMAGGRITFEVDGEAVR